MTQPQTTTEKKKATELKTKIEKDLAALAKKHKLDRFLFAAESEHPPLFLVRGGRASAGFSACVVVLINNKVLQHFEEGKK